MGVLLLVCFQSFEYYAFSYPGFFHTYSLLLKAHKFDDFIADVKDKNAMAQGEDKSWHAMKVLKNSKNQRQRKVFALPA